MIYRKINKSDFLKEMLSRSFDVINLELNLGEGEYTFAEGDIDIDLKKLFTLIPRDGAKYIYSKLAPYLTSLQGKVFEVKNKNKSNVDNFTFRVINTALEFDELGIELSKFGGTTCFTTNPRNFPNALEFLKLVLFFRDGKPFGRIFIRQGNGYVFFANPYPKEYKGKYIEMVLKHLDIKEHSLLDMDYTTSCTYINPDSVVAIIPESGADISRVINDLDWSTSRESQYIYLPKVSCAFCGKPLRYYVTRSGSRSLFESELNFFYNKSDSTSESYVLEDNVRYGDIVVHASCDVEYIKSLKRCFICGDRLHKPGTPIKHFDHIIHICINCKNGLYKYSCPYCGRDKYLLFKAAVITGRYAPMLVCNNCYYADEEDSPYFTESIVGRYGEDSKGKRVLLTPVTSYERRDKSLLNSNIPLYAYIQRGVKIRLKENTIFPIDTEIKRKGKFSYITTYNPRDEEYINYLLNCFVNIFCETVKNSVSSIGDLKSIIDGIIITENKNENK